MTRLFFHLTDSEVQQSIQLWTQSFSKKKKNISFFETFLANAKSVSQSLFGATLKETPFFLKVTCEGDDWQTTVQSMTHPHRCQCNHHAIT